MLAEPIFRMVGIDLDEDGDYCAAVAHFCTDPGGAGQVILWFIDVRPSPARPSACAFARLAREAAGGNNCLLLAGRSGERG